MTSKTGECETTVITGPVGDWGTSRLYFWDNATWVISHGENHFGDGRKSASPAAFWTADRQKLSWSKKSVGPVGNKTTGRRKKKRIAPRAIA